MDRELELLLKSWDYQQSIPSEQLAQEYAKVRDLSKMQQLRMVVIANRVIRKFLALDYSKDEIGSTPDERAKTVTKMQTVLLYFGAIASFASKEFEKILKRKFGYDSLEQMSVAFGRARDHYLS